MRAIDLEDLFWCELSHFQIRASLQTARSLQIAPDRGYRVDERGHHREYRIAPPQQGFHVSHIYVCVHGAKLRETEVGEHPVSDFISKPEDSVKLAALYQRPQEHDKPDADNSTLPLRVCEEIPGGLFGSATSHCASASLGIYSRTRNGRVLLSASGLSCSCGL